MPPYAVTVSSSGSGSNSNKNSPSAGDRRGFGGRLIYLAIPHPTGETPDSLLAPESSTPRLDSEIHYGRIRVLRLLA
jgi:hypothetical protein